MRRIWMILAVLILLAACGKDNDQPSKPRSLTSLDQEQVIGMWVDMDANVTQYYPDGSVRIFNLAHPAAFDPEAPTTYTFVNAENGPRLLLNYSSDSIHTTDYPIIDAAGCGDTIYSLTVLENPADTSSYFPVWRVGEESVTPITTDELMQTWTMFGFQDITIRFEDDRAVEMQDQKGEWLLEGSTLTLIWPDKLEPVVAHIVRVERCESQPIIIMLMDEFSNFYVFVHPSIAS